jgi:hypothetical protein
LHPKVQVMEKLGIEPRTFSTQQALFEGAVLRRCHTTRPYPRV